MQNITQKMRILPNISNIRKFLWTYFIGFIYRKYSPFLKGLLVCWLLSCYRGKEQGARGERIVLLFIGYRLLVIESS